MGKCNGSMTTNYFGENTVRDYALKEQIRIDAELTKKEISKDFWKENEKKAYEITKSD